LACLHVFAQQSTLEPSILRGVSSDAVDLRDFNPGGANDKVVDGVLWDEDLNDVVIIQSKYVSSGNPADLRDQACVFFHSISLWDGIEESDANNNVKALLESADFNSSLQNITLNFCISVNVEADRYTELFDVAKDAQELYERDGRSVTCNVFGASTLCTLDTNLRREASGEIVPSIDLHIANESSFIFEKNDHRVMVAAVKAASIRAMYKMSGVGVALFESNK
jgi:hypothetical protein